MIKGLISFTDFFKENKDDYVVIGGLATAMVMHDLGFTFRATKDIDLVVISKNNEEFLKKLLRFIKIAEYKTKQRTKHESKHNLFRFLNPKDDSFPEQIELFAIHKEDSEIVLNSHIIPIETPEYYDDLSAILLDEEYFKLLVSHTTEVDGLHVATPEVLIPLKMHAHINLLKEKSSDAKKHLRDVIKLSTLLDPDETIVTLEGEPKNDFIKFLDILDKEEENRIENILKGLNQTGKLNKEFIINLLKKVYIVK